MTIGTGDWNTVVRADGDVLVSEQFVDAEKLTKRTKDLAEAKTQVRATIDEKDPGVQAKKAGGVVGKTDTIVSLTATLAADKSFAGKPMELTAVVSQVSTQTMNGKVTHQMRVKDIDANGHHVRHAVRARRDRACRGDEERRQGRREGHAQGVVRQALARAVHDRRSRRSYGLWTTSNGTA